MSRALPSSRKHLCLAGTASEAVHTRCAWQESHLAVLWTIGVFALNFGPVVVGPVLDYVGPKLTAILGGFAWHRLAPRAFYHQHSPSKCFLAMTEPILSTWGWQDDSDDLVKDQMTCMEGNDGNEGTPYDRRLLRLLALAIARTNA